METKEVITALEKLANKLGTTAEKIFGYYVKNAKMERVFYIIETIICIAFFITGLLIVVNYIPENSKWLIKNEVWVFIGSLIGIAGFVGVVIMITEIRSFINSFVNPEYEALEDLLTTLSNMIN